MKTLLGCTTRQSNFMGWNSCYLKNGLVTLIAVPDIGGRVMAYNLGDYPFLFVDPDLAGKLFTPEENLGEGRLADWKNYGGDKTWPSPQGWETDDQWHGPPDPVLDTGRYTLQELSGDHTHALIRMVSPPDHRTGVQITRQFRLCQGSSRVFVDLCFRNIKEHPIRWSIWDVVQLRAEQRHPDGYLTHATECFVTTPLNPQSRFEKGYNIMFGAQDNPQWRADPDTGLFQAQYLWEIGKVGIDSPAGWIAFSNNLDGYAFSEQFEYDPKGEYPDEGVTVECWTVGAGIVDTLNYEESQIYLMETEVLSSLRDIGPGESTEFSLTWGACRSNGIVTDVTEAGCVTQPLAAVKKGEQVQLHGKFGVFDQGDLELVWSDEAGNQLAIEQLWPISPLEVVTLDRVTSAPSNAASAELWVRAEVDERLRLLTRAEIE